MLLQSLPSGGFRVLKINPGGPAAVCLMIGMAFISKSRSVYLSFLFQVHLSGILGGVPKYHQFNFISRWLVLVDECYSLVN